MAKYQIGVTSNYRYRASASERRRYGGTIVTQFLVFDPNRPKSEQYHDVNGYGPTAADRKRYAVAAYAKSIGKDAADLKVCRSPKA